MSILELLKLPTGFGYLLLVLGLILSLAPWFHGLDFGVLKVPDFSSRARRVLKVAGPLALALAIGLHVPMPTQEEFSGATPAGPGGLVPQGGAEDRRRETQLADTDQSGAIQPNSSSDQRFVTTWQDGGCLYPVRSVGGSGRTATVRFDFGEEAERTLEELFVMIEPTREIGAKVWAQVPRGDAWAPGIVRDTRTNHFLIELDPEASCSATFEKPQSWLPRGDVVGIRKLEVFR